MASCTDLVCGTGTGNFPKPGDPDLNSSIISAQTRFGGILVSWTYPALLAHAVAHTILYRGTNNNVSGAVPYATVSGSEYFDTAMTETPTQYYYWIRMVSVNGTVGDFIGPATAIMHPAGDSVAAQLTGRIAESFLNTALRERINQITDVASALSDEIQERLLGSAIFSDILAEYQDRLDAVDTLVVEEIAARVSADSALVAQVNLILAKANENAAAIQAEQAVRASETGALALAVNTVQATANDNTASIQNVQTAVSDIELGLSATWTLRTDVNGHVAGFGLYNDGNSSDFTVVADNFAIATPGLAPQYPFIVGTVNGQPTIVMNAPTYWDQVIGADKPESGATRNVFRGAWSTSLGDIKIGDIVLDGGNSWSAITAHTASTVNRPPSSGTVNTWWTLYGAKGEDGATGAKTAVVSLYRRSVNTPALPSNPVTYEFATKSFSGVNNFWTAVIPSGNDPLWVTTATAYGTGDTDTIDTWEWAAPVIMAQNGFRTATVTLYRRATGSTPPTPGAVTYNFDTGVVSGTLNGWSTEVPGEHQGRNLWVTMATALEALGSNVDTIESGEWSTPAILSSVPISEGDVVLVPVFRRLSSMPAAPSGSSTYNFNTRTFVSTPTNWSEDPPSGSAQLRMSMAAIRRVPGNASVPGTAWSAPVTVPDGAGTNVRYALATLYRRTTTETAPALPNGNTTFTFSSRNITGSLNGWSPSIPAASGGAFLWTTHAAALSTSTTDTIASSEWMTPYIVQGTNTATIYRRATSTPATPSPSFLFPPAGWSTSVPPGSDPVWESEGTKLGDTNEWAWNPPVISALHWVRPGTTMINGNQIFTGDAYVDTLQIKGNAVTLPLGSSAASSVSVNKGTDFTPVHSFTVASIGVPAQITASVTAYNRYANSDSFITWIRVSRPGKILYETRRSGNVLGGRGEGRHSLLMTVVLMDSDPPVGNVTYTISAANHGNAAAVDYDDQYIGFLGLKR